MAVSSHHSIRVCVCVPKNKQFVEQQNAYAQIWIWLCAHTALILERIVQEALHQTFLSVSVCVCVCFVFWSPM